MPADNSHDIACLICYIFLKRRWGYCNCLRLSVPMSGCPPHYLLLNHRKKSNQIWCVSCSHEWGVQRHFSFPHPLGPWGGAKRSNIILISIMSAYRLMRCACFLRNWPKSSEWMQPYARMFLCANCQVLTFSLSRENNIISGDGFALNFNYKIYFKDFQIKLCVLSQK